ncbi:MAG: hypothetical protein AAF329_12040 [Cyanobacteria bacterium P01_A01_bin.17]
MSRKAVAALAKKSFYAGHEVYGIKTQSRSTIIKGQKQTKRKLTEASEAYRLHTLIALRKPKAVKIIINNRALIIPQLKWGYFIFSIEDSG